MLRAHCDMCDGVILERRPDHYVENYNSWCVHLDAVMRGLSRHWDKQVDLCQACKQRIMHEILLKGVLV